MNSIEERVPLPDPQHRYKVHPMDLAEGREDYLKGWWLGVLASPQLFLAMAAALWLISNNVVTPVLVPLAVSGTAGFAGMCFVSRAWDFIPGKRQDINRVLTGLTIAAESVKALALLLGVVLLLSWAVASAVPTDVITYSLGAGLAVVAIMLGELAVKSVRGTLTIIDVITRGLGTVSVVTAVWICLQVLPATGSGINLPVLVMGGAVLTAVWVLWLLYAGRQSRRPRAE